MLVIKLMICDSAKNSHPTSVGFAKICQGFVTRPFPVLRDIPDRVLGQFSVKSRSESPSRMIYSSLNQPHLVSYVFVLGHGIKLCSGYEPCSDTERVPFLG